MISAYSGRQLGGVGDTEVREVPLLAPYARLSEGRVVSRLNLQIFQGHTLSFTCRSGVEPEAGKGRHLLGLTLYLLLELGLWRRIANYFFPYSVNRGMDLLSDSDLK